MPQNPTNITDSPEFKDFCKNNNLDVLNLESINVFLYATYNSYKVLSGAFLDNDEALTKLEEESKTRYEVQGKRTLELEKETTSLSIENEQLREMIMEIAKNIKSPDIQQINENWNLEVTYWWTLFDKWNN